MFKKILIKIVGIFGFKLVDKSLVKNQENTSNGSSVENSQNRKIEEFILEKIKN